MDATLRARFQGIVPALASPCDAQGCLDLPALEALVDRLLVRPVAGLYLCGATGDFPRLSTPERLRIAEVACAKSRAAGRLPIVHVAHPDLREACALARDAARQGAAAVSSAPPYAIEKEDLPAYYAALVQASGLPLLVYHSPGLSAFPVAFSDVRRWLSIDGVGGLKYSALNPYWIRWIRTEFPDAVIYSGPDELLATNLLFGADGGIGMWYDLLPELFLGLRALVVAGRADAALDLQNRFADVAAFAWEAGIEAFYEDRMAEAGLARRIFRDPIRRPDPAAAAALLPGYRAALRRLADALADATGRIGAPLRLPEEVLGPLPA